MAWYSELKRRHWYCINGFDMIKWYKRFLYDEWWNSLSEEDKTKIEELRKREKEESDRHLQDCLKRLGMMSLMIAGLNSPYYDKYGDVHDKLGFPK